MLFTFLAFGGGGTPTHPSVSKNVIICKQNVGTASVLAHGEEQHARFYSFLIYDLIFRSRIDCNVFFFYIKQKYAVLIIMFFLVVSVLRI